MLQMVRTWSLLVPLIQELAPAKRALAWCLAHFYMAQAFSNATGSNETGLKSVWPPGAESIKGHTQAYHPSRIRRTRPRFAEIVPVAEEILTGTLSVPVCDFSKKREKMSEKNLIPKLNSHFSKNLSLSNNE